MKLNRSMDVITYQGKLKDGTAKKAGCEIVAIFFLRVSLDYNDAK